MVDRGGAGGGGDESGRRERAEYELEPHRRGRAGFDGNPPSTIVQSAGEVNPSERVRSAAMSARVAAGGGTANVATGIPVLDHLLVLLARTGRFELALELPPGDAEAEVADAGRALGEAFAPLLRADGAPGHGSAFLPAEEALAQVALEVSGRPLVASNVDLTEARAGGLGSDLTARFLDAFAEAAGLTLHVRLIDGEDSRHVLEAIFKALGAALAQAADPKER